MAAVNHDTDMVIRSDGFARVGLLIETIQMLLCLKRVTQAVIMPGVAAAPSAPQLQTWRSAPPKS